MNLVDRMQELLEAERAGVKCLDAMADHAADMGRKELFTLFRNDEGKFCAGLFGLIQARGGRRRRTSGRSQKRSSPSQRRPNRSTSSSRGRRGSSGRSTRSLRRRGPKRR